MARFACSRPRYPRYSRFFLWRIVLVCILYNLWLAMGLYVRSKEGRYDHFADCGGNPGGVYGVVHLAIS